MRPARLVRILFTLLPLDIRDLLPGKDTDPAGGLPQAYVCFDCPQVLPVPDRIPRTALTCGVYGHSVVARRIRLCQHCGANLIFHDDLNATVQQRPCRKGTEHWPVPAFIASPDNPWAFWPV